MMGNADDLRTTAGLLDKVDASLNADYGAKSGKDFAEIEALMKAETWFSAEEAIAAGFVDAIMPTTAAAKAKANARAFNLAVYDRAPEALTAPEPEADDSARQRMLARLGLYERTAA
ncbi:Clp protease [Sphingomonas laterariae]|uniref:Clp protease n=1 Tax=Edaphosphingomonas laterariae TaxID=861865 RepID=A0A239JKG1_9SPHN|nr:ATP-dependent Clp protease proteolytic subunit [Sphingomonas laterariae]SNT06279.1 Clp protease [Sphingomonas laterariae]